MDKSIKYALVVIVIIIVIISVGIGLGQRPPHGDPQPTAQATEKGAIAAGLATFRKLVNPANAIDLGFAHEEDASKATAGTPMKVFEVGLEDLRAFTGKGAEKLLIDVKRSFYPVRVDSKYVSSVFVDQQDDGYRATTFGNKSLAVAATKYRAKDTDFLIWIPSTSAYFVGRYGEDTEGSTVFAVSVYDIPRLGIVAGQLAPLSDILSRLKDSVAHYNGLPQ